MTTLQTKYQVERDAADRDRVQLAELQVALDKLRADDHTATKMVSRYMSVCYAFHSDRLFIRELGSFRRTLTILYPPLLKISRLAMVPQLRH
jgi:hypothetical protein